MDTLLNPIYTIPRPGPPTLISNHTKVETGGHFHEKYEIVDITSHWAGNTRN